MRRMKPSMRNAGRDSLFHGCFTAARSAVFSAEALPTPERSRRTVLSLRRLLIG